MSKLTAKQEKFVQGLVAGLSQREAYKQAYSTENMKDTTIDSHASRLIKSDKTMTRYRELLKEFSNLSMWTRESAFNEYEWLKNVAKSEIEQDQLRKAYADAFISGLDGMNKMTFANDDLANKKIRKEIEMLDKKIQALEGNEVDTSMMQALVDVIDE